MRMWEIRFQIRDIDVFQHGDFRQIHSGQRRKDKARRQAEVGRDFKVFDGLYNPRSKYVSSSVI